jgi:hypothetical protein
VASSLLNDLLAIVIIVVIVLAVYMKAKGLSLGDVWLQLKGGFKNGK